MKKSKTDLFIILYPRGRNQWDWENRCAIDSLQRGKNRGERTENRKRCGVYRRLNTVLSTGWAEGCSLSMCPTRAHTLTHKHFVFLQKATQDVSEKQLRSRMYGAILGGRKKKNYGLIRSEDPVQIVFLETMIHNGTKLKPLKEKKKSRSVISKRKKKRK